jgi:hypothetical protein
LSGEYVESGFGSESTCSTPSVNQHQSSPSMRAMFLCTQTIAKSESAAGALSCFESSRLPSRTWRVESYCCFVAARSALSSGIVQPGSPVFWFGRPMPFRSTTYIGIMSIR